MKNSRHCQHAGVEDRNGDCLAVGVFRAVFFVVGVGLHAGGELVQEMGVLLDVVGFVGLGKRAGQVGEAGFGFGGGVGGRDRRQGRWSPRAVAGIGTQADRRRARDRMMGKAGRRFIARLWAVSPVTETILIDHFAFPQSTR